MIRASTITTLLPSLALLIYLTKAEDFKTLSKASFKVHIVRDGEKVNQFISSAGPDSISEVASKEGFHIDIGQSVSAQASFVDEQGDPTSIHQAFLRFVNRRTAQDNVFLLKRKGKEMRADLNMKNEIQADLDFWQLGDVYGVEMIMGDWKLGQSVTWVITEEMRFAQAADAMFATAKKGVFDFDVGVKKYLLPEFETPLPGAETRAPLVAIVVAMVAVLMPLPMLIVGWWRMGVFPLKMPQGKGEKLWILGFELCLLGHVFALVMFWVKWNIVMTWKVMGVLMIPTMMFGRIVLAPGPEKR